jgi:hypothetical protein
MFPLKATKRIYVFLISGRLAHIRVDLEAHIMRKGTSGVIANDLELVEEVWMEVSNIIMMKEEVLDMPMKIQVMEVLGEVLPALRLLMTGFKMMSMEAVGSQIQNPSQGSGHLTFERTWIGPIPPLVRLLEIF